MSELWHCDVDSVVRRNETAIRRLFQKNSRSGKNPSQTVTGDYIPIDVFRTIVKNSGLRVSEVQTNQAISESKLTNIYESDPQNTFKTSIVYGEYLEALCRLTLKTFEGSELETRLSLSEKLKVTLKQIIPKLTGYPYLNQVASAEEPAFSESDGNITE